MKKLLAGLLFLLAALPAFGQITGGGSGGCTTNCMFTSIKLGNAPTPDIIYVNPSGVATGSPNLTYVDSTVTFTVGSGTGATAGVQMGYSGTSGISGIYQTGATVTGVPSNAAGILFSNSGKIIIASGGNNTDIYGQNTLMLTLGGGTIFPGQAGITVLGATSSRFASAFLGSSTGITASAPAIGIANTLNSSGVTFNIFDIAITDTASAAASTFATWRTGATTMFSVNSKTGLITTNSPIMLASNQAFTNGAAAQVATMTNGPTAGNPTKWIPINDNGTTRYMPAW